MRRSTLLVTWVVIVSCLCFASHAMAGSKKGKKRKKSRVIIPSDENVKLRVDYWFNELDASVKITSGLLTGTSVEAFETLGMDVHQQTYVPMIVSLGRFGFHLEFWRNTYLGEKILEEDLVFDAKVYPAGDRMQSKLVLDNIDFHFSLDLMKEQKVDLGPVVGIRYQRFEVWLDDVTSGESANKAQHVPMPYVGAGLNVRLGRSVNLGGELSWMNVTMTEYDYKLQDYLDFNAYLEVRLTKNFAVCGGCRYLNYRLLAKKDDADYALNETIQGMFVGAVLIF